LRSFRTEGFPSGRGGEKSLLRLRYVLILPAVAALVGGLWYVAVNTWAVVLRRMAQSVSTWEELEEPVVAVRDDDVDQPSVLVVEER
jgi:hypothetical protein